MGINTNTALPAAFGGAGLGGIETPPGRLGERLFRTCRSTAARAARSVSRLIDRVIHSRSRSAPLVRAQTNSQRRASLRKLDFPAADTSRSHGLQVSPGAVSSQSMPNCVLRGVSPTQPSPADMPIAGVRLKPGRSAGALPTTTRGSDGPPPLPSRPPGLGDPFNSKASPAASPTSASTGAAKPTPAPRSRSVDSGLAVPPSHAGSTDNGHPVPPPRSRSAGSLDVAPASPSIVADGKPTPPPRGRTPYRTGQAGPVPIFRRSNPAGPITTQIEPAPLPKPPGNGEPPR